MLIETWSATLPWAVSLAHEARLLGARPMLSLKDEPSYWQSLNATPASQLGKVGDHEWAALRSSDAYVILYGPLDTVREESLPAAAVRRAESNNHELMRLIQKHGVRSVRWDLGRTSEVWARRYGVDLAQWRNELIVAASADPRPMHREGLPIADRLRRGRDVSITHRNGTSLDLRLAHRPSKLDDGVIDEDDVRSGNVITVVPSGVASTPVLESYAEGTFVANGTGAMWIRSGEVALPPGRWEFRHGTVTDFHLRSYGPELKRELHRLGNPRVPPGQLSVGLNPRITSIPLLFDQERGAITLEIGRNVHLGGRSRGPHLSAYLSLRGGSLDIDGRPVVREGELVAARRA